MLTEYKYNYYTIIYKYMSTYKFSTDNGTIKGEVRADNEEQAAKKAFVQIAKQKRANQSDNQILNKTHEFSVGNSSYTGEIKKLAEPITVTTDTISVDGAIEQKDITYEFSNTINKI
jgi:hypothetical protein